MKIEDAHLQEATMSLLSAINRTTVTLIITITTVIMLPAPPSVSKGAKTASKAKSSCPAGDKKRRKESYSKHVII